MFIIPMAGLSSRFFKDGYNKPKYQLDLNGITIFEWSVLSFKNYFNTDKFIFIYRDIFDTKDFLKEKIKKLDILNYSLICLPKETLGQADTVYQAIKPLQDNDELYIFNIDSRIDNFIKPLWVNSCDGYLEVFKGDGEHWSFVKPGNDNNVLQTTEKNRISDLCCDGLYYFKSKNQFCLLFEQAIENNQSVKGEFYIAPLYNKLIEQGYTVKYDLINSNRINFCGTPYEYEQLKEYIK